MANRARPRWVGDVDHVEAGEAGEVCVRTVDDEVERLHRVALKVEADLTDERESVCEAVLAREPLAGGERHAVAVLGVEVGVARRERAVRLYASDDRAHEYGLAEVRFRTLKIPRAIRPRVEAEPVADVVIVGDRERAAKRGVAAAFVLRILEAKV